LIGSFQARDRDGNDIPDCGILGFAGRAIQLSMRQPDGATLREHLQSAWRQTGERPELLEPVDCPDEMLYLWDRFLEVSKRRTSNGFGLNPVPYADIAAWATMNRVRITPFELEVLDRIEALYVSLMQPKVANPK
jgi:hypothetical protein